MNAFNANVELQVLSNEIREKFSSSLDDPDEANDILFAIAKAEWDCGSLSKNTLTEISRIVESGADIARWRQLGASPKDLAKRNEALLVFLEKLKTANPRPKKPKKTRLRDSIFTAGDCLAIDLKGNFGGAIVLTGQKESEWGLNLILVLDFMMPKFPSIEDFKKGQCLMVKNFREQYEPYLQYCYAKFFKKAEYDFQKIGNIQVGESYDAENERYSYGHWNHIPESILKYNSNPPTDVKPRKVSEMISKDPFG
ncbi:hypothetical protein EHQ53_01145 [Leptospira langatensis]|uniref:Uncharacterized protein n=1 Tax=Leptospira langatensis TaxID=2484983 RepID=A0A5F1ZWN1_9LEPT|nr:hypothetical protein [Leptospira langatensis]TGJ98361.1 hypothetical protein EHO57_17285 [Leptospira langatensis]TGL43275.1 hypothetical protein EHQ53_01145 [Leptospira langatensis]